MTNEKQNNTNSAVIGITAEYNPFHNGHKYQIRKAKEQVLDATVIAVMSGNFVQRGEPAIIDKFTRAEYACRNGVDVVIELPFAHAIQAAHGFAHGAIELMKLADVDYVSFGSECGNLENLLEIAETPVNPDHLHQSMDKGLSFPRAYSLLTTQMRPNDILAVSYLKEMENSALKPLLIQRTTNYLDDQLHETSSALAIRTALYEHRSIEGNTPMAQALQGPHLPFMDQYYPYLRTLLLTSSTETLASMFFFSEGIENHLRKNAAKCKDWDSFLSNCVNYRYTASRIRRTCLALMVQLTKQEVQRLPQLDTLRVLAFNDRGRLWLHDQRDSGVRIASRFADVPYPWRALEYRSTLLYTSVFPEEERIRILENEIGGAHYIK